MTLPLTERQEQLWRFIKSCDRSPNYDEMKAHMGTASKSVINRLIGSLHSKGFVTYTPHVARSVVALDPPPPASNLAPFKTSELLAELERRGILLGLPS